MHTATMTQDLHSTEAIDLYITGLQNAHALEKQATQLIERQLDRLESYPEIAQLLQTHLVETEHQIERLDQLLGTFGESRSMLKDLATSVAGNMAALGHAVMQDEVLKNHFANFAFENMEIASYKSLITMAEATGHPSHVSALEQTLQEEEKTAQLLRDMVPDVTLKYMRLLCQGEQASR
jgi:ferritin-like metal-binding protein YciE